jgi:hypothetical protein
MSIIKVENLNLSNVSFSDVKIDNHGRKMVYVNYNGGKILVQTPKMYVPNGIKRWRKKDAVDNKDDSFEMEMSFRGEDKSDKNSLAINEFHKKLLEFDSLLKGTIMTRSKEWLGKQKVSMETIEDAYYSPCVKIPTDKNGMVLDYPSRVRVKLDREREFDSDNFTGRFLSNKKYKTPVLIFDESKTQIDINESNFDVVVPKGSQVICVLELVYLSITSKVSPKWKLVQAKVFKNQQSITGYAMIDDELEDDLDSEIDIAKLNVNESDSDIQLEQNDQQHQEDHQEDNQEDSEDEVQEQQEQQVQEDEDEVQEEQQVQEPVIKVEEVAQVKVSKTRAKKTVAVN